MVLLNLFEESESVDFSMRCVNVTPYSLVHIYERGTCPADGSPRLLIGRYQRTFFMLPSRDDLNIFSHFWIILCHIR